jgi:hypothetical protein
VCAAQSQFSRPKWQGFHFSQGWPKTRWPPKDARYCPSEAGPKGCAMTTEAGQGHSKLAGILARQRLATGTRGDAHILNMHARCSMFIGIRHVATLTLLPLTRLVQQQLPSSPSLRGQHQQQLQTPQLPQPSVIPLANMPSWMCCVVPTSRSEWRTFPFGTHTTDHSSNPSDVKPPAQLARCIQQHVSMPCAAGACTLKRVCCGPHTELVSPRTRKKARLEIVQNFKSQD